MAFGLTITTFIYTTDTIMEAVMDTKHCSQNFKNSSVQVVCTYTFTSSGSALTVLKPSTSLADALCRSTFTLSQSLCCWSTHNTLCCSPPPVPSLVRPRIILFSFPLVLYSAFCRFWTHPEDNG